MTATGLRPGSRNRGDSGQRTRRTSGPAPGSGPGGATMHARFAQRVAALRRRARRVWTWLAVVLVLVIAVVVTLWWSPAFVVSEVTVSGVDGASEVAIGAQERAGIPFGMPLARVDTDAVAGRVQEDPRIAEADVSREWPSGVDLQIALREPALVVDQRGSLRLQTADASGVIFDEVTEAPADLMLVRASRGDLSAESLTGVLSLLAALPPEAVQQIPSVRLMADGELSFALGSVQVDWGPAGQEEVKAEVLAALLAQEQIDTEGDHDIGVDLTTPQTPVVTGLVPDDGS